MASCIFNHIPIDIVEIIVVFSRCPKTFENASFVIHKLKYKDVQERIIHKLIKRKRFANEFGYYFKYDKKRHNEYDKPAFISESGRMWWRKHGYLFRKHNLPFEISTYSRDIIFSNLHVFMHTDGSMILKHTCDSKSFTTFCDGKRSTSSKGYYDILK